MLLVFGYGSLMYAPACPERVRGVVDGWLPGWRRAFDKRSVTRGCAHEDAWLSEGLAGWTTGTHRVSLALGMRAVEDGSGVAGKVIVYDAADAAVVLAELDRREGARPGPPQRRDGYRRATVVVEVGAEVAGRLGGAGRTVEALAWVTHVEGAFHEGGLDVTQTAAVLAHATPRMPGPRALGADYLTEAARVVREAAGADPVLEALVAAVRPWLRDRPGVDAAGGVG
ncbi:MAG: gamma-glutamylcyclotransferase [Alphaproteobacteria bacterium]|nr:gamma-glutamylcyclotransferase [Alphaproteobacteria bacterium]